MKYLCVVSLDEKRPGELSRDVSDRGERYRHFRDRSFDRLDESLRKRQAKEKRSVAAGKNSPAAERQINKEKSPMFPMKWIAVAVLGTASFAAAAAPESYTIDPQHTYPSLEFSHMGLSIWRGKFDRTRGKVVIDRAAKTGSVDIVVDAASINFGLAAMDEKARSDDFFNVEKFPAASYRGTLRFDGDTPASVDGQVTIMGVTRPLTLGIRLFNCMPHPMLKKEVCGADAEGIVNWGEYGMKMSQYGQGEAGRVQLRIQVEAIRND